MFLLAQFLSQNSTIILQATSYEIYIPSDFTYKGILRLTRQAAEWKDYYFYSCADVEIVNPSVSCISQYVERILNKIEKPVNKTSAGLKSTLQRFRIYFA